MFVVGFSLVAPGPAVLLFLCSSRACRWLVPFEVDCWTSQMRLSLTFAATLIHVLSVPAAQILVQVGANGRLEFSPSNITANLGDIVAFQFQNNNHSVTRSSFANPCQKVEGSFFDSSFYPTSPNVTVFPRWLIVIHTLDPLWFFCAQTDPVSHCQQGMVFSINARENETKNFAAFQTRAMGAIDTAVSGTSSAVSSSSSATASTSGANSIMPASFTKGKNLAGPIAAGVVGGLLLLAGLGFLVYWVHCRLRNSVFAHAISHDSVEKLPVAEFTPNLRYSMAQPDSTGTSLLATLRVLSTQMHGLEQQIQAIVHVQEEELPQYTPRPPL
ncbi:hypothetical protein MVEN_00386500 [Mycena venus]|uniref:Cupredoxin n=1 Tax=Mycena venus TaxID=2733690 RepID=A0A8H6YVN0_9AGAR|nr:hypothetical protein MVEN_00386500 [Mycena venus]